MLKNNFSNCKKAFTSVEGATHVRGLFPPRTDSAERNNSRNCSSSWARVGCNYFGALAPEKVCLVARV